MHNDNELTVERQKAQNCFGFLIFRDLHSHLGGGELQNEASSAALNSTQNKKAKLKKQQNDKSIQFFF